MPQIRGQFHENILNLRMVTSQRISSTNKHLNIATTKINTTLHTTRQGLTQRFKFASKHPTLSSHQRLQLYGFISSDLRASELRFCGGIIGIWLCWGVALLLLLLLLLPLLLLRLSTNDSIKALNRLRLRLTSSFCSPFCSVDVDGAV